MPNSKIQLPNVAGIFYPAEQSELKTMLDGFFQQVTLPIIKSMPKALIVPHAGYIYSGLTAAYGFASLKPFAEQIKQVVVAAPAHRYPFHGVAFSNADAFLTPLGKVNVNHTALNKINQLNQAHNLNEAFVGEHALEVELPFLQTILNDFSLIPLMIGDCEANEAAEVFATLWNDEHTIFIISSDLSHYLPYQEAQKIDSATAKAILNLDARAIGSNQACGHIGIRALLKIAKIHNLKVKQLDLRNSGDTAGETKQVVGYGAFAFLQS